jgi:predicted DCC family thiol-disulfide oxidoreductase YuxK
MSDGPVLLYDGLCGFCDASVQWVLTHDRGQIFRFAPLQGDTARAVLAAHPEVPPNLDSLILVDGDRVHWYAGAVLGVGRRLPGIWGVMARLAGIVPRALLDPAYRLFARHRLRFWGRRDACRIPTPAERARFLP